jgi:hypothetical protein
MSVPTCIHSQPSRKKTQTGHDTGLARLDAPSEDAKVLRKGQLRRVPALELFDGRLASLRINLPTRI